MKQRKLLSLMLSAALALSLAVPALAAGENVKPVEGDNSTYIPTPAEAMTFVMSAGWMTGTDTGFEPEATVDRATIYEMLWKMAGKPQVDPPVDHLLQFSENLNGYRGKWYENSARWAYSKGLTTGTDEGYQGERTVTKAEVLTILHRYMRDRLELSVAVDEGWTLDVFEDADKVQDWAAEALTWGWLSGVACQLDADATLDPDAPVTRVQLAQMLTVMGYDILNQTPYSIHIVSYDNDGRTVPAVVTMPKGVEGKVPAVVLAHGHGGSKDENTGFGGLATALAEAGIATIRMDFPGCGDSAESFRDNTMTNMISDVLAGVDYLVENYDVDADKLGILGYSMGGRIASQIAGTEANPFQSIVLLSAANGEITGDLAVNLFGSLDKYNELKAAADEEGYATFTTIYGQVQELGKAWFADMEEGTPQADLAGFTGPVLVLHGDVDTMITDQMNKDNLAACQNGREVIVTGADHGYGFYSDQPDVTAAVTGAVVDFFSENLLSQ